MLLILREEPSLEKDEGEGKTPGWIWWWKEEEREAKGGTSEQREEEAGAFSPRVSPDS